MNVNTVSSYNYSNAKKTSNNINFGKARLNLLATSDNHFVEKNIPHYYETVKQHFDTFFPEKAEKSTLNMFAIGGDWSINPSQKGLLTNPKLSTGEVHFLILDKIIGSFKQLLNPVGSKKVNLETVYGPGNHDLDAGAEFWLNLVKKGDFSTVWSNANLEKSNLYKSLSPLEKQKITNSKVYSIPDDKVPNKRHNVLVMEVLTPSIDFYNPDVIKGLNIPDKNAKVSVEDQANALKDTYKVIQDQIDSFKQKYNDGKVIIMSHAGNHISSKIADKNSGIDLILNGHDHKKLEKTVNNVPIVSLNKDSKEAIGVSMLIDDNGKVSLKTNRFDTLKTKVSENNPITKALRNYFAKDEKPLIKINAPDDLSHEGIRFENNHLANFVTDSVLKNIQKADPDVQILGIQSSTFRGGLFNNSSNLDLLNLLSGSVEKHSEIMTGQMQGKDIVNMIMENVGANLKDEEKNTIIQWSGIKINKALLREKSKNDPQYFDKFLGAKDKSAYEALLKEAIQVKDKNGNYRGIDVNKDYKMALPSKFFIKDSYSKQIKAYTKKFVNTHQTMNELFRDYLKQNNFVINIDKFENDRIIT